MFNLPANNRHTTGHGIACIKQGVSSRNQGGLGYSLPWSDIIEIRAYKIDLFTLDEINFSFKSRDGLLVTVSEEQPGFDKFIKNVEKRFPSITGWEQLVVQPPFERNETILYSIA